MVHAPTLPCLPCLHYNAGAHCAATATTPAARCSLPQPSRLQHCKSPRASEALLSLPGLRRLPRAEASCVTPAAGPWARPAAPRWALSLRVRRAGRRRRQRQRRGWSKTASRAEPRRARPLSCTRRCAHLSQGWRGRQRGLAGAAAGGSTRVVGSGGGWGRIGNSTAPLWPDAGARPLTPCSSCASAAAASPGPAGGRPAAGSRSPQGGTGQAGAGPGAVGSSMAPTPLPPPPGPSQGSSRRRTTAARTRRRARRGAGGAGGAGATAPAGTCGVLRGRPGAPRSGGWSAGSRAGGPPRFDDCHAPAGRARAAQGRPLAHPGPAGPSDRGCPTPARGLGG
jgi:hypothetical protein